MDLGAIRTALAAQITTELAVFNGTGVIATAWVPAAMSAKVPTVVVWLKRHVPHQTFGSGQGGLVKTELRVTVLVPAGGADFGPESLLDDLVSTGEMVEAIETDATLGGTCEAVVVGDIDGYESAQLGGNTFISCDWLVTVYATG